MSFEEAAAVPHACLAAYAALGHVGKLIQKRHKTDKKVLVLGASGGVGTFAVQLAKSHFGCYVVASCSSKNAMLVKSLGADQVVDYTSSTFLECMSANSCDVIVDCVGGDDYWQAFKGSLAKDGVYVTTVGNKRYLADDTDVDYGSILQIKADYLFRQISNKLGVEESYHILTGSQILASDLPIVASLLEKGILRVVIDKVFNLTEIQKAHELSETHHAVGKIVVRVRRGDGDEGGQGNVVGNGKAGKAIEGVLGRARAVHRSDLIGDDDRENDFPDDEGLPRPPQRGNRKKGLDTDGGADSAKNPHVRFDNFGPPGAVTPPGSNNPYNTGAFSASIGNGNGSTNLPVSHGQDFDMTPKAAIVAGGSSGAKSPRGKQRGGRDTAEVARPRDGHAVMNAGFPNSVTGAPGQGEAGGGNDGFHRTAGLGGGGGGGGFQNSVSVSNAGMPEPPPTGRGFDVQLVDGKADAEGKAFQWLSGGGFAGQDSSFSSSRSPTIDEEPGGGAQIYGAPPQASGSPAAAFTALPVICSTAKLSITDITQSLTSFVNFSLDHPLSFPDFSSCNPSASLLLISISLTHSLTHSEMMIKTFHVNVYQKPSLIAHSPSPPPPSASLLHRLPPA